MLKLENKGNPFTHLSQVGVIVRDMEKYASNFEKLFGMKPVNIVQLPNEHMKNKTGHYYEEDGNFSALLAFYNFGDLQLEVIQPLSGKSIWQDFLDQKGEGIHHIRFSINNMDQAEKHFTENDILKAQDGYSTRNIDGLRWAYYDTTEQLSFFTEVFNEFETQSADAKAN